MKLLHVIDSMDPTVGGPCQGIRNMTSNLESLGIYSEVASVDEPGAGFLKNESLLIHALGPGVSAWGYSSKLQPWLLANLDRFDIVILHGLWLYTNFATFKVLRKFKLKSIRSKKYPSPSLFIMPHGMMDPYFQRDKDRKFKAVRNYIYWHLIESKIVNGANGLFFTCVTELMVARETFTNYNPKLELNIGYGIEDPPVRSDKMMSDFFIAFPELANTSYVLFFSRIHEKTSQGVKKNKNVKYELIFKNINQFLGTAAIKTNSTAAYFYNTDALYTVLNRYLNHFSLFFNNEEFKKALHSRSCFTLASTS